MLRRLLRALFRPRPPPPPPDPRLVADPWLGRMFAVLPDRYRLGPDAAEGAQVLRRTGRARFNPMRVWLRRAERVVRGEYEVRGDPAAAKALLDARVSQRLGALGLSPAGESVDDWGGSVLTRKYEGRCDSAEQAAAAVRFLCEESEQQVNLAAE
ncbi:MAG TPA: hypothetical protein VLT85_11445 [Terriglobales bacterium]|nr:hypothetical protein [Terriglobales bacterium]